MVILAAAVLYVSAVNDVTARKTELTQVTASVSSWQAAANTFASLEQTAQQRTAQVASVRALADGRFPWSQLLSQIGGLMPAKAALNTLQATAPPASSTPSATATSTTGVTAVPSAVALTGCAQDQNTVAETMVQLRRVSGVSDVSLSSSTDGTSSGTTAATAASGSSTGGAGGCPFPVQFQMSLTLAPTATASSSAGTSSTSGDATPSATTVTTPQAGAPSQ